MNFESITVEQYARTVGEQIKNLIPGFIDALTKKGKNFGVFVMESPNVQTLKVYELRFFLEKNEMDDFLSSYGDNNYLIVASVFSEDISIYTPKPHVDKNVLGESK